MTMLSCLPKVWVERAGRERWAVEEVQLQVLRLVQVGRTQRQAVRPDMNLRATPRPTYTVHTHPLHAVCSFARILSYVAALICSIQHAPTHSFQDTLRQMPLACPHFWLSLCLTSCAFRLSRPVLNVSKTPTVPAVLNHQLCITNEYCSLLHLHRFKL